MSFRPALFERMGAAFARSFGNVDCVFVIDGAEQSSVRGILRQWRDLDLGDEMAQPVEGTTHLLSVASSEVSGLVSQRDSVTIYVTDSAGKRIDSGTSFDVKNHEDDGRAMLKIYLTGDI